VSARKMHLDEMDIDVALVRRLLIAQFPQWGDLPLEPVASAGTSNALYRLGQDMVVRLPRVERDNAQVEKEHLWLPRLAPHLPLRIPVPLGRGKPRDSYPCDWSVFPWLEGEHTTIERVADPRQAATALARFVAVLQRIDPGGGPPPGLHNFFRGVPLPTRDAVTRDAIARLDGVVDTNVVTAAWEASVRTPAWDAPPVWIHGDLLPGNLLFTNRRLSAVIDFGGLGVGDPACDVIVAWSFLSAETRNIFRAALTVDDATWARGRGWALSVALIALPYYRSTNPEFAALATRMIDEVLVDHNRAA
jgi:aminoglycoside phosphotransferase (APT) family kinase protein